MSLSSDTEGPPPGPLQPFLSHRTNPVISEEEGEGDPTPCTNVQNGPTNCPAGCEKAEMDCTKTEVDMGREKGDSNTEVDGTNPITQGDSVAARTLQMSESTAALNYDSVKYTLVVDEHAQLELISLKDCLHSYEHNADSDGETVYQSANEEEDPEYEEERMKNVEAKKQGNDGDLFVTWLIKLNIYALHPDRNNEMNLPKNILTHNRKSLLALPPEPQPFQTQLFHCV